MANLFIALLNAIGVSTTKFGDDGTTSIAGLYRLLERRGCLSAALRNFTLGQCSRHIPGLRSLGESAELEALTRLVRIYRVSAVAHDPGWG